MSNITHSSGLIQTIPLSSEQGFGLSEAMIRIAKSERYISSKQAKDLLHESYTLRKEALAQKVLEKRIHRFMLSKA